MKTATEMMQYVGCSRWYPTGGLLVACTIKDVLAQGSKLLFLLEPTDGLGRVWVDSKALEVKE